MSNKRANNMKHWAATRHKARRPDSGRAETPPSQTVPLEIPPRAAPAEMINCQAINSFIGVYVRPGAHVRSRGLRGIGNQTGIVNEGGVFDGPDTVIE